MLEVRLKNNNKIKLTHIITGLNTGGAEMMLQKLLSAIDRDTFDCTVISLTDCGAVGDKIRALGFTVHTLGMKRGVPNPIALLKLVKILRQIKPDAIQTWMYHADLLGGLAAKLAGSFPVAWGIRHSDLDPKDSSRMTIWTAKLCAILSGVLPTQIVCCSEASERVHVKLGYNKEKMIVIPNGFDLTKFKPDANAKGRLRDMLGLEPSAVIIGHVARFNAQKDHNSFVEAAGILSKKNNNVHFVLCGDDVTDENTELNKWIDDAGIVDRVHLLGRRSDVAELVPGFDIATSSSSFGEGFPNVVGEAMACAVPCVVTDVGDSALIVGDTGEVVNPRDPVALASAWENIIDLGESGIEKLGQLAKKRVEDNFSLPKIVNLYETIYTQLIKRN